MSPYGQATRAEARGGRARDLTAAAADGSARRHCRPTRAAPIGIALLLAGSACTGATDPDARPVVVQAPALAGRLALGGQHTCALSAGDVAYCWGQNTSGQLGLGRVAGRFERPTVVPTAVATPLRFVHLTAGDTHTCGLTREGVAYCWGWNGRGELGDGTTETRAVPTPVATSVRFRALVAAHYAATCGLALDGRAYCWGTNNRGSLGDGSLENRLLPTPVAAVSGPFRHLTLGYQSCALTEAGRAYCWGGNTFGALGVGDSTDRLVPTPVAGDLPFAALSAGGYSACALTTEGAAYCWGINSEGELGQGSVGPPVLVPRVVATRLRFRSLTVGGAHACALTAGGRAYCWGSNGTGAIGDGTASEGTTMVRRPQPTAVRGGLTFQVVVAGSGHTCALTPSSVLYCWGSNTFGQLGDSTQERRTGPILVRLP